MLPLLAAAMAAGILLADLRLLEPGSGLILSLSSLSAGLVARHRPRTRALAASLLFLGAGAYCLGTRLEQAQSARPTRSFDVTVEGTLCASAADSTWLRVDLCQLLRVPGLAIDDPGGVSVPPRVRVLESRGTPAASWLTTLRVGQRVRVRLRIRPPRNWGNPGSPDRVRSLDRAGIGALASVVAPGLGVRLPQRDAWWSGHTVQELRLHIGTRLAAAGPGGGLLRALATGDRSGLTHKQSEAFARLGIAHLLAVSGLHLGLVAGLAYALLRPLMVRIAVLAEQSDARLWAVAGALALALAYALVAGWGVPVRRALVFLLALGVSLILGRNRSAAHALALAAMVVLVFDPGALFDLGAQLSFVASTALLGSLRESSHPAPGMRLPDVLSSLLRTSTAAVAVTAPVLSCHLAPVTPVGLVANLMAVPWTAILLLPAALTAATAALLPVNAASELILSVSEWLGRLTLTAVELGADRLPPLVGGARPAAWALGAAFLLALAAVRSRRMRWRLPLALMTVLLLRYGPVASVPPSPPRLVGLDVGQGDAVLIQGRRGAMLVDGGRATPGSVDFGRAVVLPALRALEIRRLDLVVATHADLDHWGGLVSVLTALPVGELWIPLGVARREELAPLLELARARGARVREGAAGGAAAHFGDLCVTPLWPPAELPEGTSRNDRSLLLRIELEGVRVLLTGDLGVAAEEQLLASTADVRADILKLGHHGSEGSSSPAFLEAVAADVALLSAPCPGRGALPSLEVVRRVRRAGQALWWTGRDGAIFVALGRANAPIAVWGWEPESRCSETLLWDGTH